MNIFSRAASRPVRFMSRRGLISLKTAAAVQYFLQFGRFPRLKNPVDLNEKLMWLSFNSDTSQMSILADKYEVRDFIKRRGYADILIPCYGVYETADEIDFDALPASFVIKSTNGTAQTILVADKSTADLEAIRRKAASWQTVKFGLETGEPHYLAIKPRIMIEAMLSFVDERLPVDYKFMCFNGQVHSCLVCTERDSLTFSCRRNLFDVSNWVEIPDSVNDRLRGNAESINRPDNLDRMTEIAATLSKGFKFVRVDLYSIADKIYFGELTFTPAACRIKSITPRLLNEMGGLISL